jgi:hypothetical protein
LGRTIWDAVEKRRERQLAEEEKQRDRQLAEQSELTLSLTLAQGRAAIPVQKPA